LVSPYFFENVTYWSAGDEAAHFTWLSRIDAIGRVRGEGTRVYLDVDRDVLDADSIRELEAVYRRYGGDLSQLIELKEAVNAPN
jgi:aminopeptidase C